MAKLGQLTALFPRPEIRSRYAKAVVSRHNYLLCRKESAAAAVVPQMMRDLVLVEGSLVHWRPLKSKASGAKLDDAEEALLMRLQLVMEREVLLKRLYLVMEGARDLWRRRGDRVVQRRGMRVVQRKRGRRVESSEDGGDK